MSSIPKNEDPTGSSISERTRRSMRRAARWLLYHVFRPAERIGRSYAIHNNKEIINWISKAEQPFFLFINYMDVHDYNIGLVQTALQLLGPDSLKHALLQNDAFDPDYVSLKYNRSLVQLDNSLGHLLQFLQVKGYMSKTAIAILSDHGEMLGEKGLFCHHVGYPYNPLLHVPLVIKDPNRTSKIKTTVRSVFSTKDIGSLILWLTQGNSCLEYLKTLENWCGAETMGAIDPGIGPAIEHIKRSAMARRMESTSDQKELCRAFFTSKYKIIHNIEKAEYKVQLRSTQRDRNGSIKGQSEISDILDTMRNWEIELDSSRAPTRFETPEEIHDIETRLSLLGYI
jgi:hypothetical protein